MKPIELLSPAGTLKNMRYAFAYGADAVYAGQPRYSLRVRNNDFQAANLAKGIAEAHDLGKKFFLATNVIPHNAKVKTFMADIEPIIAMKPDALIMADPGLIMLVRENWPDMPVHLSVQANTVNYATVKFWQNMGLTRIILSRELSLDEIADIRQHCPDMELEVFVHGGCASPIPGVVCCRVILTTATPTKALAPILVAGNMTRNPPKKMPKVIWCCQAMCCR